MELTDYLFPADYFKVLHEMHTGMASDWHTVKVMFERLFSQNLLHQYCNFKYDTVNRMHIISSDSIKDCQQLIYIYLFGSYLDVYHYVKLPVSIIKKTNKMQSSGEMSQNELFKRMILSSWIVAVRKTLEQAIKEIKETNKLV